MSHEGNDRIIDSMRDELPPEGFADCVLCEKEFKGHGHESHPLAEGLCCDACNIRVQAARIEVLHKKVYGDGNDKGS